MNEDAEEALRAAFADQMDAMQQGDTNRLAVLLDDGFTLTHVTGYRQPKSEWLTQMKAGQFRYHDIRRHSTEAEIRGDSARVTGRVITDATVYRTRADWRLQLAVEYKHQGDSWIAVQSIATTW